MRFEASEEDLLGRDSEDHDREQKGGESSLGRGGEEDFSRGESENERLLSAEREKERSAQGHDPLLHL